jgi:hypothetical protein
MPLAAEGGGGHSHVVEVQRGGVGGVEAELPVRLPRREARRALLEDEGGDALVAEPRLGHRHHHRHLPHPRIGDEGLAAT